MTSSGQKWRVACVWWTKNAREDGASQKRQSCLGRVRSLHQRESSQSQSCANTSESSPVVDVSTQIRITIIYRPSNVPRSLEHFQRSEDAPQIRHEAIHEVFVTVTGILLAVVAVAIVAIIRDKQSQTQLHYNEWNFHSHHIEFEFGIFQPHFHLGTSMGVPHWVTLTALCRSQRCLLFGRRCRTYFETSTSSWNQQPQLVF